MSVLLKQNNSKMPVDVSANTENIPLVAYNQKPSAFQGGVGTPMKKEMSLRDIWGIIARRKWSILSTMALMLALAVLYTLSTPPVYRANAVVQIEREGTYRTDIGGVNKGSTAFDALTDPYFKTRYEMLKSRVIAQETIKELSLYDSLVPPKTKKKSAFSLSSLSTYIKSLLGSNKTSESKASKRVDYVGAFQKKTLIQPIAGTHLVEVVYDAPDAELAKDVVMSIINNFIKLQIETKSETGEYAKTFFTKQLEEAGERLDKSESVLLDYSNKHGILRVDDKQTVNLKKLGNLDDALVQAEIKRIEAESLYSQMQKTGSVSAFLSSPVVGSLKARLVKLEGDYQEMLKTFKPNYPSMVSLRQQINNANGKLQKEKGSIQRSMKADYLAAKQQEGRIRGELRQFNKKLGKLQNSSLDYNNLKREVTTNTKLYDSLQGSLDKINVASQANTSSISIVEPAVVPIHKFKPKPKLNLLLGLLSGLILGLALAFLREAFDQSVNSAEDLQNITGLPVLSNIPRISKAAAQGRMGLISAMMPDTAAAEAYRILAAKLRFMKKEAEDGRVMLITSAQPNKGKSVSASNVACSLAKMGMKVLLVDADLRRPSMHEKLGIDNGAGLTDFLSGEIDLVGITQPVKQVSGLYAITAGKYTSDPVSLLSHERMSYLTTRASQIFDYVIVDAPPVIGFADTLILSSLATSTIIVDQEKTLKINNVKYVLEQLGRVSNNVEGYLLVNSRNKSITDNKDYAKHQDKMKKEAALLLEEKKINLA
ncbi:MAG: polysaccharide biosynthesis tyrosine autokinase [Cocleimonas sp.]